MWAAIIMALLSFFTAKKAGASDSKALLAAGVAGAGTYYVATETEWGEKNLNWFESEGSDGKAGSTPVTDSTGKALVDSAGNTINKVVGGTADVLKSWGGTGTAAVIGTAAVAGSSSLQKYLPWIIGAVVVVTIS